LSRRQRQMCIRDRCKTQMASLGAVCIPLSDPPIEKCVGAIHAGHLPLSKAAQALLDTLKGFLPT
ncbi:hypothetical protein ELP85_18915, partial [Klebsiella pneumoniae]|nr:hypothetical protein [Klebsiella pneumoniae]